MLLQMNNKLKSMLCLMFSITFPQPINGGQNVWLEPQIFEFGKPMTLNCNITEKVKAFAWWIVEEGRSPKRISSDLVLSFTSANHGHSAIYECFHTFESSEFIKYSREALVIESHCSRVMLSDTTNVQNLESTIGCQFKHINFLNVDDCDQVECDGEPIKSNKATSVVDKMKIINVNFTLRFGVTKCSYGCKNSKISIFLGDFFEPQQIQAFLTTMDSLSHLSHQNETERNGGPLRATMLMFIVILTMGLAIVLMAITFVACYCKLKQRTRARPATSSEGDIAREVTIYEKLHHCGINGNQDQPQDAYSIPMATTYINMNLYDEIKEPYLEPKSE